MRFKIAASILLLLMGLALFFVQRQQQMPTLPVMGKAPDFVLTDATGSLFDSQKLKGKIWVVDFIFTQCAGPCPLMAAEMGKLQTRFKDQPLIEWVSISVNPSFDTPEVLAKYALKVHADPRNWHFLTGTEEAIRKVAVDEFKLTDPEQMILHSQKFVLIDQKGQIRGYYDGGENPNTEALAADIALLMDQTRIFGFFGS